MIHSNQRSIRMELQKDSFGISRQLGPAAFTLWLYLTMHADNYGHCFASQQRMARDTGLSRRTLRRTIHLLERRRMLAVVRSNGRKNVYCIRSQREPAAIL